MKIIASNKRARYDYEIKETLVGGLVLAGNEVKSVKTGAVSLKGSFVIISAGEAYLENAHITAYKYSDNTKNYEPTQRRKILLHKKEINHLKTSSKDKGYAIVPLAIGVERGLVKLKIGLGKGKKRYDKREKIKKKQMMRDAARESKPKK